MKLENRREWVQTEIDTSKSEFVFTAKFTKPAPTGNASVKRPARHEKREAKSGRGVPNAAPTRLNVSVISSRTHDVSLTDVYTPRNGEGLDLVLDNVWERSSGTFQHKIKSPIGIDAQSINMNLENTGHSSESILRSIKQHMPVTP